MTNAEKFRKIFKEFATEVWAFPEKDFLTWLNAEYEEPTTKNNLGVDCISRVGVIDRVITYFDNIKKDNSEWSKGYEAGAEDAIEVIKSMPSVTPQEPQTFKWCTDCKEYDQEKHCCHRWSKVIRDTVEEMKQEPILDKIRAEIESTMKYQYAIGENQYAEGFEKSLEIIDKYKAEQEK